MVLHQPLLAGQVANHDAEIGITPMQVSRQLVADGIYVARFQDSVFRDHSRSRLARSAKQLAQ
jgi:hypothetical protein